MCIAIYHDAGCVLTQSEVDNSWRSNPDGGGFTFFDNDGRLRIQKYMEKHEFERGYDIATDKYPESPFAVHFRIATHGGVNIDNCHPFRVDDGMTLIHNGIIPVLMEKDEPRSDTRVFCDEYLNRLPDGWIDDKYLFDMVEEYIGASKLVVLSNNSDYPAYIFNERQGHWSHDNKFWYSNRSYCASPSYGINTYPSFGQSKLWTPDTIDEDNIPVLGACRVCSEHSVFDDLCYFCDSCQNCSMDESDCKCYASLHEMNDADYEQYMRSLS